MTSSHHGPLRPGLHVLQWRVQRASTREWMESQKRVVVRIRSATRLREVGIASNRKSECCGEYVPGLVHRPSHHGSGLHQK